MAVTHRSQDWPPLLRRLKDQGYSVRSIPSTDDAVSRFLVDLADWQLQFTEETPLFFGQSSLMPANDEELAQAVQDVLLRHNVQQDCFVAIDRPAPGVKKILARTLFPRVVLCDAVDQSEVLAAPQHTFTHALQRIVTSQFKLIDLVPYHIGGRDSRFFGRHEELNRILRHEEADISITGIRRVGKTFLLTEAFRKLRASRPDEPEPLFYDCASFRQPHDFIKTIVHDLDIRQYNRRETAGWAGFDGVAFLKRFSHFRKGRIVLFLDEADQILLLAKDSPELLELVRATINNGSCRYIMAGFQRLMLEITHDKSPLYLGFESIRLSPFTREETKQVVLGPFTGLGVRFEDQEKTVSQIYDDTGGMPPLVQYYCGELAKILELRGEWTIRTSDVNAIHSTPVSKTVLLDSFRDSASKEDQLLIYIALNHHGEEKISYSAQDIYEALDASEWHIDWDKLDQAFDRLVLAGFLTRDGQHLRFTVPAFASLVFRYHNLKFTIAALKKELQRS